MCAEKNLPGRFEDWIYRECKIKKQSIYNHKNLYELMRTAPKLMNCRVNMMYFIKSHEILLIILRKMKNRYHGKITFLAIVKLVTQTLQNRL